MWCVWAVGWFPMATIEVTLLLWFEGVVSLVAD